MPWFWKGDGSINRERRRNADRRSARLRARPEDWHARSVDAALVRFKTSLAGIPSGEAQRRLSEYGPNRLVPAKPPGPFIRFARQFRNILIYVLLTTVAIMAALGRWVDSGVIAAVVIVNAIIGFIQEGRAERALEAIRSLLSHRAIVIRDGWRLSVPAEDLVPGDVVIIRSGDKVPADLRLLQAKALRVQEAILTGESVPVDKAPDPVSLAAPLGERTCMAYSGTLVTYGQARGIVVATGDMTEIGRVSMLLAKVEPLTTPLLRQMRIFGYWLTGAILLLAGATFAFGTLVRDYAASDMFLAAVGVAVAAIPEGLPAIMTITLAIGVERMAKRNAIIRRSPAVETLGSVSVICSDKTGTLTRNEMTVRSVATSGLFFEISGVGYSPEGEFLLNGAPISLDYQSRLQAVMRGAILCSDADVRAEGDEWRVHGDPMEAALLIAGMKAALDPIAERKAWPRTDEIPFEPQHRFMATLHHNHEGHGAIYVKGAPERILEMCAMQRDVEGDRPIDRAYWWDRMEEMAARGDRVLALAIKPADADERSLTFDNIENGLTLLGFLGLADPPRAEAVKAIEQCHKAGIRVKMITGDHASTARAIAEQLGLRNCHSVLTGADLDALTPETLMTRALDVDVFARTNPEHKLKLVEALQRHNQVVAMTGDGVNDAPALKRADVGVAMGKKGAEAAKEASDMVLADDNFASIAYGIEEGRTVYDNLKKGILFILPTSAGEAFTIVAAIAFGGVLPITAVQILWVNMITAVTLALALAFEPTEAGTMKRPPRPRDEPILSRFLIWRTVFVSTVVVLGVFGIYVWLEESGADIKTAQTAAVNTLVMFEVFYLFSIRKLQAASLKARFGREAKMTWAAAGVVVVFQVLFTYAPFMQWLFHSRPLAAEIWAVSIAIAATVFLLVEAEKLLIRVIRKSRGTGV